ncbi:hypothetical protein SAMD00079811_79010 (plasmid) [Scytonema sp. HK-05]|nr:hypothetical protein SAMD00079811_79010 [Scytonema sp. HK-05]
MIPNPCRDVPWYVSTYMIFYTSTLTEPYWSITDDVREQACFTTASLMHSPAASRDVQDSTDKKHRCLQDETSLRKQVKR